MSATSHAVKTGVAGRKALTDAERKANEAKREAARKERQKKLDTMPDAERIAYVNAERTANFKSLGSKRVTNAVVAIARIKNLANRSYNFTPDQADKVVSLLQDAVDDVISAFKARLAGGATKAAKVKLEL